MKRQTISLDENLDNRINTEAQRTGRTKAETVRNILDAGIQVRGSRSAGSQPTGIGMSPTDKKSYSVRNVFDLALADAGVISDNSIYKRA